MIESIIIGPLCFVRPRLAVSTSNSSVIRLGSERPAWAELPQRQAPRWPLEDRPHATTPRPASIRGAGLIAYGYRSTR